MAWIRSDCAKLSDDWLLLELDGWEYKAWDLFLHRVKAEGARGSVSTTSLKLLARQWNIPEAKLNSMMAKAGNRIVQQNGRWHIKNWWKYQEDFRSSKSTTYEDIPASTEIPEQPADATTLHYTTLHLHNKNKRAGWFEKASLMDRGEKLLKLSGFSEAWDDWLHDRKERGKMVTERAARSQLDFLEKQPDPIACIRQSIDKGWTGIFEIKTAKAQKPKSILIKQCRECGFEYDPYKTNGCPRCHGRSKDPPPGVVKDLLKSMDGAVKVETSQFKCPKCHEVHSPNFVCQT